MSSLDLSKLTPEQLATLAKEIQAEQDKRPVVLTERQKQTQFNIQLIVDNWINIVGMTSIDDAHGLCGITLSWADYIDWLAVADTSPFVDEKRVVTIYNSDRIPAGVVKNNGVNQRIAYHLYRRGMKGNKWVLELSPSDKTCD
jgi:hypothetical protein